MDDAIELSNTLITIKENHRNLELDIYNSINDIQSRSYIDYNVLNKYLESFFISRIGLRALIGNYINQKSFLQMKLKTYKYVHHRFDHKILY